MTVCALRDVNQQLLSGLLSNGQTSFRESMHYFQRGVCHAICVVSENSLHVGACFDKLDALDGCGLMAQLVALSHLCEFGGHCCGHVCVDLRFLEDGIKTNKKIIRKEET